MGVYENGDPLILIRRLPQSIRRNKLRNRASLYKFSWVISLLCGVYRSPAFLTTL